MAYTESSKVTQKQLKELKASGAMPADVYDYIQDWRKTSRSRWITIKTVDGSHKTYFAEDMRYTMFYKGERASHRCGGEWGGFKSKDLVNTRMQTPVGTWIVETGFFCGKPLCHIVNVGPIAISN